MSLSQTTAVRFHWRGSNPLPVQGTTGTIEVSDKGKMHLTLADGVHLPLCECDCASELADLRQRIEAMEDIIFPPELI